MANEESDDDEKLWPGGVLLFLNEGDGNWTTITLVNTMGTEYKSVALVDVNADGLADVIASYKEGTVLWMFDNLTAISGSAAMMLSEDAYANAIVFGDIAGLGSPRPEPRSFGASFSGNLGKNALERTAPRRLVGRRESRAARRPRRPRDRG